MKILSRRQCLLCVVRFLAQWAWLESVCVHDHSSALTSGIVLSFHQMENMKIPKESSSTLIYSSCKKNSNLYIDIIAECTQKHSERNHIISQSFLEKKGFPIQLGVLPVAESSIMQNGESKISSYWLCRIIIDGALFQFSKAIWNMRNYFSILAKTMRDDVKMYSSFSLILKANVLWLRFAPKRMEIKWWSAFHESFGKLAKRSLFDNFVCISKPQFLLPRPCRWLSSLFMIHPTTAIKATTAETRSQRDRVYTLMQTVKGNTFPTGHRWDWIYRLKGKSVLRQFSSVNSFVLPCRCSNHEFN